MAGRLVNSKSKALNGTRLLAYLHSHLQRDGLSQH